MLQTAVQKELDYWAYFGRSLEEVDCKVYLDYRLKGLCDALCLDYNLVEYNLVVVDQIVSFENKAEDY